MDFDLLSKKGFKGVVFYEEVYEKAQEFIKKYNEREGYRKIRSMSHLIDMAIDEYVKKYMPDLEKNPNLSFFWQKKRAIEELYNSMEEAIQNLCFAIQKYG